MGQNEIAPDHFSGETNYVDANSWEETFQELSPGETNSTDEPDQGKIFMSNQ